MGSVRQILVLLLCALMLSYFVYHAIEGRHGLEARAQLQSRASVLEAELASLEVVRARLEQEVALLVAEHVDRDMLDEMSRKRLQFAHPRDLVLIDPQ